MLRGENMADQSTQELPPAKRRRLIFRAVLRGVLVTTALVVLYYVLPLDRPWGSDTAIRLLIGLLVFAGVTVWQVRTIAGSRYPGLRAAEALGLIVPLYLLLFASTYFVMERASAANFSQPLTRTDALYFSVTVFTTVGFGDITARSETARVVLIVQMLADLALLGAGAPVPLPALPVGDTLPSARRLTGITRRVRWRFCTVDHVIALAEIICNRSNPAIELACIAGARRC